MLTVAQVGLSRLAILLFLLVVFHAEGLSLGAREIQRSRILLRLSVLNSSVARKYFSSPMAYELSDWNIITVGV